MQELLDELEVIEVFESPSSAPRMGEVTKKQTEPYKMLEVEAPSTL